MKKFFNLSAIIAIVSCGIFITSLTSCNGTQPTPPGGNGDTAKYNLSIRLEEGSSFSSKIDEVKAYIQNPSTILATAPYNNGVLNFELPATLASNNLIPISEEFSDLGNSVTISDTSVKGAFLDFRLFKSGVQVDGNIEYYLEAPLSMAYAYYIYVDKDLTVSGTGNVDGDVVTLDLKYKKGWNLSCEIESYNIITQQFAYSFTTTLPSGLKWYIYSED
ncbi:MAG: hypothetical protein LBS50_01925 [Prevotellaceae bacterium]|jgi:hypothetical protein|nr:hypothetical protein [Prevotellaceae bacterium]